MAVYPERRNGRLTGKWIAEVTQHGERRRKRFDSKRDGDRWADHIALIGEAPPDTPDLPKGPTFADVASQLKMSNPERAHSSDASGRKRMEYVIEKLGDTPLADVTTPQLDELVRKLRKHKGTKGGPLASSTINRYLSAVSAVLHYGKSRGYVTATPTVPWQEDNGNRLHWLTEDDEEAICRHMTRANFPSCALLVRVLTLTGMRWGELAGLKPEQIEPENGCIRLWETKNGEARTVPINPDLAASLKLLVADKTLPSYYTFRNRLKLAAKDAGQSPNLCIHSLRHTTATRLTQRGVPLQIVQKYLGHKTIITTTKYAHINDDDLQNALKKISPHAGQTEDSPNLSPELV